MFENPERQLHQFAHGSAQAGSPDAAAASNSHFGRDQAMIELGRYQREDGNVPVRNWLEGLRDICARVQIEIRLRCLSVGNFGDCKPVGEGVLE